MMISHQTPLVFQKGMNKPLHILVIDDDAVDRMAIRRLLAKTSLSAMVVESNTAASAKSLLSEECFDCVFLDFRLPDTDGLAFIKQLRYEGENLPIIVLTGQGDEHTAVELMKAGATDYLAKSRLSPESLSSLIRHAMNAYRAEQRVRAAQAQLRQTNILLKKQNQELADQRRQIEQQNLQLLEANQHKSEFLATMSHELRTPLNSIMGFSQVLKSQTKGSLNDYQLKMANCIYSNGENLLNLVNDILDMSTLEANRLELIPYDFDLEVLIKETLAELSLLAEKKGLHLFATINLDEKIVYNDRQRLKQILINLLANGIKFTHQGYVSIEVNALAKNSIELIVRDTGVGIPNEQLHKIFEPFRQCDQSVQRKYSGTGLGLAITHSLVSMMEGLIIVSSQVGQGTHFRIQIPRRIGMAGVESPAWYHNRTA